MVNNWSICFILNNDCQSLSINKSLQDGNVEILFIFGFPKDVAVRLISLLSSHLGLGSSPTVQQLQEVLSIIILSDAVVVFLVTPVDRN